MTTVFNNMSILFSYHDNTLVLSRSKYQLIDIFSIKKSGNLETSYTAKRRWAFLYYLYICQSIPLIHTQATLHRHLDKHSNRNLDGYSVDSRLKLVQHLNWHSIGRWLKVGKVLTKSYISIDIQWCVCEITWLLAECWLRFLSHVDQALIEMLIEMSIMMLIKCRLHWRYQSIFYWGCLQYTCPRRQSSINSVLRTLHAYNVQRQWHIS